MAGRLAEKIAVITGASSGMGLVTARRFVEEGAQVVITGRREKELAEAAAEIGKNDTKRILGREPLLLTEWAKIHANELLEIAGS